MINQDQVDSKCVNGFSKLVTQCQVRSLISLVIQSQQNSKFINVLSLLYIIQFQVSTVPQPKVNQRFFFDVWQQALEKNLRQ